MSLGLSPMLAALPVLLDGAPPLEAMVPGVANTWAAEAVVGSETLIGVGLTSGAGLGSIMPSFVVRPLDVVSMSKLPKPPRPS
uniref:Putative secreted protein n=1 Tax=Anopheles triannulatus TaxID=58253 RepID=A0A2M4B6U8_9DIPT